jgi:CheY-like chemotaxis protein
MPDGGRLLLQTATAPGSELSRAGLRPGRFARLSCADTGCGMSPETARRAFEPFFSTRGKGKGTGLGLATVYGAVTDAGGAVTLRSQPGAGTTISIYLPSAAYITETPAPETGKAPHGNGEHILVVEDNDAMREVARRILSKGGYQVTCAASREEALATCGQASTPLDLLLSDVVMPGPPIREFIALVHASRPGLPVLLMSGYSADHVGGNAPLPPIVAKPFDSPALLRQVRKTLDDRLRPA